jgi:hypothetical protein
MLLACEGSMGGGGYDDPVGDLGIEMHCEAYGSVAVGVIWWFWEVASI